jgi:hypothetical protein
MNLAELNPRCWQRYARYSPEKGGEDPLPEIGLTFVCPKCGPPHVVQIVVTTDQPTTGKWHVASLPTAEQPLDAWARAITISPSVQCNPNQHGPKAAPCTAHFSIINGKIV